MKDLYHRTEIMLGHHDTLHHYDEDFGDYVYDQVFYALHTSQILLTPNYHLTATFHILKLPPPDPNNFIPFNDVTPLVVLGWLDKDPEEMIRKQLRNTEMLKMRVDGHPLGGDFGCSKVYPS